MHKYAKYESAVARFSTVLCEYTPKDCVRLTVTMINRKKKSVSLQVATAANIWEIACQGSSIIKRSDWAEVTGWADVWLTESKSKWAPD